MVNRLGTGRSEWSSTPFSGFAAPTSNTLYCPNQFFDVCLPHRTRGCIRVVAYLLRQTLGWSDHQGRPLRERVAVTYRELIDRAGLGRDTIRPALDEAEQHHFVRCLRRPAPAKAGNPGVSGLYELAWDETSKYVKDPDAFRGFFAGEGNRTYVPNQFFDVVLRDEPLLVAKVVGAVVRCSIGFQTKWGHRRQHAQLSLTHIQRYARIGSRPRLLDSIRVAIDKGYLVRVQNGRFDPKGGIQSQAAVYSLHWADGFGTSPTSAVEGRSETGTGRGREAEPAQRSETGTGIETTGEGKNTLKQQPAAASSQDDEHNARVDLLRAQGFDELAIRRLSAYPIERLMNQIEWLPLRRPSRNRLGMLRQAIEQNWEKPSTGRRRNFGRPKFSDQGQAGETTTPSLDDARRQLAYQLTLKSR